MLSILHSQILEFGFFMQLFLAVCHFMAPVPGIKNAIIQSRTWRIFIYLFFFMYSVCTKVHAYLKISFRLLFGKPKEWFIVIFPLFFFFFYRNLFLYVFSSRFVRSYVRARLIWLGAGCPLCPRQSFLRATAFIYYNWLNYALWAECSFV